MLVRLVCSQLVSFRSVPQRITPGLHSELLNRGTLLFRNLAVYMLKYMLIAGGLFYVGVDVLSLNMCRTAAA